MRIRDLDTPAVVIDLDVVERNIRNMAAHCAAMGIPLRVHTKTHKIPELAKMQVIAGSQGIVCQKRGEAEVMAHAGLDDVLVTYNIVGAEKVKRLCDLTHWAKMMVTVDSFEVAHGISVGSAFYGTNVDLLVELDTGGNRTGVQSPDAALALGQRIMELPGVTLRGLMTYPSHLRAKPIMDRARELYTETGLPCSVISGGGTGNEAISKELGCTETRSGSYLYEGMTRIHSEADLSPIRCGLRIVCTVVSVPTSDRIIIDGGMKTFREFPHKPYGCIVEHPEALINGMSVEHGHVDVSACTHRFRVGEQVTVLPRHAGMTGNLHDKAAVVRGDIVEAIWNIQGRGKVQ